MAKAPGPETAQTKGNSGAELFKTEELRVRMRTPASIYSGVCAAENWGPGKEVTKAEYEAAVRAFSGAPMGKRVK